MFAIFFEILAVLSGAVALFISLKLNPQVKISKLMISSFYETKNCEVYFKVFMTLFYVFNSIAFYFYIGPVGILFAIGLISVITKPESKIHLLCSFIVILIYGFVNVIRNNLFLLNYLSVLAMIHVFYSYFKMRKNTVALIYLISLTAILMLVNILVVG